VTTGICLSSIGVSDIITSSMGMIFVYFLFGFSKSEALQFGQAGVPMRLVLAHIFDFAQVMKH
jgi:hypothetical protein